MRRGEIETTLGEGVRQSMEGVVQMEEDWLRVLAVTESWSRELDLAESGARQLDDALTVLDRKVCKVETEQAGWSLPPSLDTVEGEELDQAVSAFRQLDQAVSALHQLNQAVSALHQLEEEVMQTKLVSDSASISQAAHQKLVTIERRLTKLQEAARSSDGYWYLVFVKEREDSNTGLILKEPSSISS